MTTGKLGVGVRDRYEEHIINVWLTLLKNYPQATVLGKLPFFSFFLFLLFYSLAE